MIPVRCFSCGKIIANKIEQYQKGIKDGKPEGELLTELGLHRYCCRRMLLCHVELIEKLLKYDAVNLKINIKKS